MIQHSPSCWEHEQFKSIIVRVTNRKAFYCAINFYFREHTLHLSELLIELSAKLDHKRVVQTFNRRNHPLIKQYLQHVQRENINVVNEAVNQLYVEEENYDSLRESIDDYDEIILNHDYFENVNSKHINNYDDLINFSFIFPICDHYIISLKNEKISFIELENNSPLLIFQEADVDLQKMPILHLDYSQDDRARYNDNNNSDIRKRRLAEISILQKTVPLSVKKIYESAVDMYYKRKKMCIIISFDVVPYFDSIIGFENKCKLDFKKQTLFTSRGSLTVNTVSRRGNNNNNSNNNNVNDINHNRTNGSWGYHQSTMIVNPNNNYNRRIHSNSNGNGNVNGKGRSQTPIAIRRNRNYGKTKSIGQALKNSSINNSNNNNNNNGIDSSIVLNFGDDSVTLDLFSKKRKFRTAVGPLVITSERLVEVKGAIRRSSLGVELSGSAGVHGSVTLIGGLSKKEGLYSGVDHSFDYGMSFEDPMSNTELNNNNNPNNNKEYKIVQKQRLVQLLCKDGKKHK